MIFLKESFFNYVAKYKKIFRFLKSQVFSS